MRFLVLVVLLPSLFVGCTRSTPTEETSAGTVHLAIWSNYVSEETLQAFTKQSGLEVKVSHYSSNEELLAKLQAGATGYDVAVPSDYMVFVMSKLGVLLPLDSKQVPSRAGIETRFLGQRFDPENRYSLPYNWGTTGIALHRGLFQGTIKGWNDLFSHPELKGRISLLDDSREGLGAALKALGFSLNTRAPEQIDQAKHFLLTHKPKIKAFTSEPLMGLVQGEFAASQIYMSDALQASRALGGAIEYLVPEEGATQWIDNLVIPRGARNLKGAHQLIDFLLRPEIAAETVREVLVAPTVKKVSEILRPEWEKNPIFQPLKVNPPRVERMEDLERSLRLYDRAWTEVKAAF